jgi:hypothetical protein
MKTTQPALADFKLSRLCADSFPALQSESQLLKSKFKPEQDGIDKITHTAAEGCPNIKPGGEWFDPARPKDTDWQLAKLSGAETARLFRRAFLSLANFLGYVRQHLRNAAMRPIDWLNGRDCRTLGAVQRKPLCKENSELADS